MKNQNKVQRRNMYVPIEDVAIFSVPWSRPSPVKNRSGLNVEGSGNISGSELIEFRLNTTGTPFGMTQPLISVSCFIVWGAVWGLPFPRRMTSKQTASQKGSFDLSSNMGIISLRTTPSISVHMRSWMSGWCIKNRNTQRRAFVVVSIPAKKNSDTVIRSCLSEKGTPEHPSY